MDKLIKFELWHCLNLDEDLKYQAEDIINNLECGIGDGYKIDNEGVLHIDVMLKELVQLKDIAYVLDDNIVICGTDYEYIMTTGTLKELGLN